MKHFRKVSAVLLAVLMVAVMLPSYISIGSPAVDAAEAGVVTNGDFSNYESYTGSSGQTAYKAEGWDVRDWGNTLGVSGQSGKGVQISKDGSHKDATQLTQVVPVNTNATYTFSFYAKAPKTDCKYVACFTYSLDLGPTAGDCSESLVEKQAIECSGSGWQQFTYTVKTGSNKYLKIRFIATGVGSGDSYLDTVALTVVNAGDTGTHAKPSLKSFGTEKNRPASDSDNVIIQPGFESTTNAQWNTTNFVGKQGVSIETDATIAHSGSKYLKYYHGSVDYTEWPMFEITCPTAGEYVFSAWVRTPGLSANNTGKASIGIINPDNGKFLCYGNSGGSYDGHYSNQTTQLRSTATDDNWHLRSVTFYVGANNSNVKIGMYGLKSTMYVDDISVHLLTKGVQYTGNQTGALSASKSSTNYYCAAEDSLIPDSSFNGDASVDFWSSASGWNNGFLEFGKDATTASRKTSLHYKTTGPASNKKYRYVKFVSVEPNTKYFVSFDYRVVSAGSNLMFIDNNIIKNATFHTPSLGSASNSWKTYTFSFSTGNYNRIGIVFQDGAGETYYDDFRFFKDGDKTTTEPAEELFPTLKTKHPEKGMSRREMSTDNLLGLGFMFTLNCTDVTVTDSFEGDYTNGKVRPFEDGVDYKLVKAGALVSNSQNMELSDFVIDKAGEAMGSGKNLINVPAEKLFADSHKQMIDLDVNEELIAYAVRVINIPESHISTVIHARPYYIFEYEGKEVVVYGDIVSECYKEYPNINDGWLEWD